jgi:hypothetical protein
MVNGNLLRYCAGRQIFCPRCERVLDWTTTVQCGRVIVCDTCFRILGQGIIDREGAETMGKALADADMLSAHNWHIVNGKLERGAQILTD